MLLAKMNWCKNKQEQISAIQKGWNTGRGRGCHVYLKLCLWISLLSSYRIERKKAARNYCYSYQENKTKQEKIKLKL